MERQGRTPTGMSQVIKYFRSKEIIRRTRFSYKFNR